MIHQDVYTLCDAIGKRLKDMGWVLEYVSRKSEACYYRLQGYSGVMRVACHGMKLAKSEKKAVNGNVVLSKITLCQTAPHYSELTLDNLIALGIGQYILRQPPHPRG